MARGSLGWRYFVGTGVWLFLLDLGLPVLGQGRASLGYLLVFFLFLVSFGSIAMRVGTATNDVATNVGGALYLAGAVMAILGLIGFIPGASQVVRALALAGVLVAVVLELVLPRLGADQLQAGRR